MPELAEVEYSRSVLETHVQGKRIVEVLTLESGGGPRDGQFDDKVFESSSIKDGEAFEKAMKNMWCAKVLRKGKQLWWEMECENNGKREVASLHPLFHFRMTGSFIIKGVASNGYKSFKVYDEEWPPKFTKCEFVLHDGTRVAFTNQRRFGRICLRADPLNEEPISRLAPDPLTDMPSLTDFTAALKASKLSIKALLLDQERVVCGVGNWIVDEVAFQSRLHPERVANSLSDEEITTVHKSIQDICSIACAALKERKEFPEDWLFHKRWNKGKGIKDTIMGHPIIYITVGGRTSAVVPDLQKKIKVAGKIKEEVSAASNEDEAKQGETCVETATRPKRKSCTAASKKEKQESSEHIKDVDVPSSRRTRSRSAIKRVKAEASEAPRSTRSTRKTK